MPNDFLTPEPAMYSTQQELEQLLLEGLNSGQPIDATPEFWADLRRQAEADAQQRRTELRKAS